jgi:hypothetical protein
MFAGNAQAPGLNAALAQQLPGEHIEITGTYSFEAPLMFSGAGQTIEMKCETTGPANNIGATLAGAGTTLVGVRGLPTFQYLGYSGIMFAADKVRCVDVYVANYNLTNKQVGAAFFIWNPTGTLYDIELINTHGNGGYGNTWRLGNANGVRIIRGRSENTWTSAGLGAPQSAEAMSVGTSWNVLAEDLDISNVANTGVLCFGGNQGNLVFKRIRFSNCSMAILAPPAGISQAGSNSAFAFDCQGGTIQNVILVNSLLADNPSKPPTTGQLLTAKNGTVKGLQILGYESGPCVYDTAGNNPFTWTPSAAVCAPGLITTQQWQ